MIVLHTCNNEEDPIKNEDARVLVRLYGSYVVFFFRRSELGPKIKYCVPAQRQLIPKSVMEFCRNSNSSKL